MSSRRARLGDAVTPGLAGLCIAAGIAREAVDAVPVVKQVLGVIVRILALAEKIDKDRDALHELVKKSVQLAERMKAALGDRTGDELFQPSIDRIRWVLEEIAEYMQKHVSRSRLSRTFSYAFTVKLHVDRLARKLEDAVQELFMVAHITTTLSVQDGARFDGEFRLLRHCEVDKLDRITRDDCKDADGNAIVHYHRARVDGTLLVVRYFTGSVSHELDRETYESVLSCDRILEELSTVHRSHPNVARVYGRGKGSIHDRFTVFKAGLHPVDDLIHKMPTAIATLLQCAVKVLDATHHLQRQGILWAPHNPPYALDEHLEPTIGLYNDLRRVDLEIAWAFGSAYQVAWVVSPLWDRFPSQEVAPTDIQAAVADCHNERLTNVLGKSQTIRRQRVVISKANLSHGFALKDGTAELLLRVLAEDVMDVNCRLAPLIWADMLLALDSNRSHRLQVGLQVEYCACNGFDQLKVHGLAEDSERIVYDMYYLDIQNQRRDEVRAIFGIPAHCREEPDRRHIIATGGPGTYRAVE